MSMHEIADKIELNAGGFPVKNASYWKRQYDSVCKELKAAKENAEFHFANYKAMQQQLAECREKLQMFLDERDWK